MGLRWYRYCFSLPDGSTERFELEIEGESIQLRLPAIDELPPWCGLDFKRCPNCPAAMSGQPFCPMAQALFPLVDRFAQLLSYEELELLVESKERLVRQQTTAQRGIASCMGLLMASCGCPHTRFLRPMARFHLPLASEDETIYRAFAMYSLEQSFVGQAGGEADYAFAGLVERYRQLEKVNGAFAHRLAVAAEGDSSINALINLDMYAKAMPYVVEESLAELRPLFVATGALPDRSGPEQAPASPGVGQELAQAKQVLDRIHDCIFLFHPDTLHFSYVNEAAARQVGYSPAQLAEMTPLEISTESDEQSYLAMLASLRQQPGRLQVYETVHWHQDGFLIPVEINLQYLEMAGGQGRFVAVVRDLSQRKKEQEEYQRLFEASRDAIVVTTQNGFIDCNQAALRMFGYDSKREFLSLHPADVSPPVQPDGSPSMQAAQQQISDAMENKVAFFDWQHKRKDGSEFPAEVLLSPFERDGELVVQGVVRDLSERQRAEQQQKKLQAKLLHAQKLESVGQLAAGIAHEINTPSQYVGSNVDFLAEAAGDISQLMANYQELLEAVKQGEVSAELVQGQEETLAEIDWHYLQEEMPAAIRQSQEGLQRITTIVRAMKEFSHPGSKERSPTNINRLIETTVTVARNEWKYVAEMELQLDDSLAPVPCLANELGQVILNLLVNGAHAIAERLGNNPEGEKGRLTITTSQTSDQAFIQVRDTGMGIPAQVQERIFDPFFTTKKVGRGTGQGLAIAHDVVSEKHGGSLTFETEAGKGTTFTIILPLELATSSSPEPEDSEETR